MEAIEYNEISKEDTERRYSLLKRTDLQADFSKVVMKLPGEESSDEKPDIANMIKVGVSIANIDFKLTNKELKELKLFSDKVI